MYVKQKLMTLIPVKIKMFYKTEHGVLTQCSSGALNMCHLLFSQLTDHMTMQNLQEIQSLAGKT